MTRRGRDGLKARLALIRAFFAAGGPPSRNAAFAAYQDPEFLRAVRIYRRLDAVVAAAKDPTLIDSLTVEPRPRGVRIGWRISADARRELYLDDEEVRILIERGVTHIGLAAIAAA